MPRGNPNPSPSTRFKPGQVANPGGKTSEQRKAEVRNAELATKIRTRLLEAVASAVDGEDITAALARVDPATLKLIKDAEDRGLGAPKTAVDLTNSDGSLKPEPVAALVHDALTKLHDTE